MKELFNENTLLEGRAEIEERHLDKFRNLVREYYVKNGIDEKLINQFVKHNRQVEEFVNDYSREDKEKFNEKETEIAILAAIFHDITKGWGDFLNHGKEGGELAEKILRKNNVSIELAHSVKLAIERHMGEEGYPSRIAKNHFGDDFNYPTYQTKVAQMVYECDILTQLAQEGFDKILLLREQDEDNRKEDEIIAKKRGITREEASIFSALQSAKDSLEIIRMNSIKETAIEFWSEISEKYGDVLEK